jgi:hypothetical protein
MRSIATLILLLISLYTSAQDLTANWSPLVSVEKARDLRLIGQVNEGYLIGVISANTNKNKQLVQFDPELDNYSTINLQFEGESIEYCTILNDKIVVLSSAVQDNKKTIKARIVSDGDFEDPITICQSPFQKASFHFSVSPNGQFLGLIANAPYLKGKNEEIGTWIFDSSLQEKLVYKLTLTNKNMKVKINVPVVSNTGVLFLIKRFNQGADNTYYAFSVDPETKRHQRKTLTLMGKRIADVKYALDNSDNLHIAGFYVSQSYRISEGSFYFKLDQTTKAITFKQNAFNPEFVVAAEGKKNYKKYGGLVDFKINEMALLKDKIYLTANHTKRTKVEEGGVQHFHYQKDNLALICLKKSGEEDFSKTIDLHQKSKDDKGFWNQNKMICRDAQLLIFNNLKTQEGVILKMSKLTNDNDLYTEELSSIYNAHDLKLGLDLGNMITLNGELLVPAWNMSKDKVAIGVMSDIVEDQDE